MTSNESEILKFMMTRENGTVSWSALRGQFCLSEGALTTLINSLKRHLLVEQDGLFYRVTEEGQAELERFSNPSRRKPFENAQVW